MERSRFPYTPYYCEENVYRFLEAVDGSELQRPDALVLVISNRSAAVAMQHQRARNGGAVLWDYHVIVLTLGSPDGPAQVYDLDSTLTFPSPAKEYFDASFPSAGTGESSPEHSAPARTAPMFKCISADYYLEFFGSDRRHMLDASGNFTAAPPEWPAIRPERGSILHEMTDMAHALFARPRSLASVRAVVPGSR